jgi:pimeloyl-ACP methyl ester carboxylesterase
MNSDVIVLIPGIGGSRLEREGKVVYDLSLTALPRLIWNWVGGGIAFQGGSAKPDDGVVATDLFNNQLIPGFFGVDDYDGLLNTLRGAVKEPDQQVFKFPYDWRASNRWAAEALDAFIRPKLHAWRQSSGAADAKLWLVGHSMGGIVARYFLEALGGAEITRHLITIGTPHRGAPKAVNALVNGLGLGPLDFSGVIRSFASTYELLPQQAVIRAGHTANAPLARVADFFALGDVLPLPGGAWFTPPAGLNALPHIDAARLRNALEFHAAIRKPVLQREQQGLRTPYKISCLFNRRQATPQSAAWANGKLVMSEDLPQAAPPGAEKLFMQGDGTVPGTSSVPIEWTDTGAALSVDEKHVTMPSARAVTDLIYNLANPLDARGGPRSMPSLEGTIGLATPSLVMAGEPFELVVDAINSAEIKVSITATGNQRASASAQAVVRSRSSKRLEFSLKKPGSYRVTATPSDPSRPSVSDWIVVVGTK